MSGGASTKTCEHYWFVLPDNAQRRVESLVKQVCDETATGRMTWLGSHGKPDREINVCDHCRELVMVQNELQQAERDGTLRELLFGEGDPGEPRREGPATPT